MAIKMTLNKDQVRFQMNAIRPDNFSYEGLGELFDYFDSMDPEQIEYDGIAICCDFSQCSLDEFLQAYPMIEFENTPNDDTPKQEAIADYIGKNGFWFAFVEDGQEIVFENF
jgi:hypothetical protein